MTVASTPKSATDVASKLQAPEPKDSALAAQVLIDRYLDHLAARQLSEHSLAAYRRDLLKLASLAQANLPDGNLLQLEPHHIRRFAAQLHTQDLSARSIARALSAWRMFYRFLASRGEIDSNPVVDVRTPRPPKRLPKALTQDQAIQVASQTSLDAPHDLPYALRDAAMFELFYSSGLRLSEVVQLDAVMTKIAGYETQGWIDFDSGEVTVTGKGKKRRIVPVGQPALEAIQAWLAVRVVFAKDRAQASPALFLSERGTRLSGRSIELRLQAHAKRLGIPARVHPHVLRHSFATHVLQSSSDLRAVQEMLGHASIAATQIYTSLDFQHLTQVYDAAHPRARKK